MARPWMIYGANGYTGELLAEEAVRRGHAPILAGRNPAKLGPIAERLGLASRAFDLDDAASVRRGLDGVAAVLHAAGPFVETAEPMLRGCLGTGAHYLDITGEIPVFARAFSLDAAARERGVLLMPGVGFDVVPTDCAARMVADAVPGATDLEIAFTSSGGKPSGGTSKSALLGAARGNLARRSGQIVPIPLGKGGKTVRFSCGPRFVAPVPWGDLETAFVTTGIPNITTYMGQDRRFAAALEVGGPVLTGFLKLQPVQRALLGIVGRVVKGPNEGERTTARSYVYARAWRGDAQPEVQREVWLETAEGYAFTALAGVRCMERALAASGELVGARTPAGAFGADFVLEIPGTRRIDRL